MCRPVSAYNKGLGTPKGVKSLLKGWLVGWFGFWQLSGPWQRIN